MVVERSQKLILLALGATIICLGVIAYYVINLTSQNANSDSKRSFSLVTETNLVDLDGNQVTFPEEPEKYKLVYSWASWVPSSVTDFPQLQDLAMNYRDIVTVYAINRNEPPEIARSFLNTIADLDPLTIVIDADDKLYHEIGGYSMPEIALYNSKGEEILRSTVVIPFDEIAALLATE
jgi:thiol-disulfide isomerase/thioredoxin